ncbi:MAG: transketolase [Bacteroidetes bacterium]|nr:transketolase [Bacteroidota bacterium]
MTYEDLLTGLIESDDRFMVLTAENRAAIRNLPDKIGDKFLDTGITEQTLVGAACGLALRGRIPVAHALATFLTMRAFEFIRSDIGISGLPVKLIGGFSGFLSEANGPTHQAIEDISLMRGIPNMNIFCPADEEDMLIGLPEVLKSDSPFYIRYNNLKPSVKHSENFRTGKAEIISEGKNATILVYGILLKQALEAREILGEMQVETGVINLRCLKPVDEEAIINAAKNSDMLVTLEDHFLTGGLYSIIAEIFLREGISKKVIPFALNNKWFKPALLNDVIEYEGFTGKKIAGKIIENISLNNKR